MSTTIAPAGRTVPAWMTWAPRLTLVWAVAYGAVRVWFATGHEPVWELPTDLMISGWPSVALCALSAAVVLGLTAKPENRWLLTGCWAMTIAWVAACAMFLLDVVGGVLPGLGVPFDEVGLLSRLGGLIGAGLIGATALGHHRRLDPHCLRCSRTRTWANLRVTPRWAVAAAWSAVAGCVFRIVAQTAVGWDAVPLANGVSMVVFEAGFLLAGAALPLLLVYRLGRIFPRWMLLWPGAALGVGITAYFGVGLVQMIATTLAGEPVNDGMAELPESFFWAAVPAYVVWGAGLAVATYGYYLRTRKPCKGCGR